MEALTIYGVWADNVDPPPTLADLPVHREMFGGMAVAMGSLLPTDGYIFKPYVYRGTGLDQFPETCEPTIVEIAEKRRRVRAANEKRRETVRIKREEAQVASRKRREQEHRERQEELAAKRAAGWKPGDEGRASAIARRREAREQFRQAAYAHRAAPGWKPLTLGDLFDE